MMTPEQKITRMTGLCARLVSLVCAADAILPVDKNAGYSLLNEALAHSREVRELRSPSTQENGVPPNLAIMDGDLSVPPPPEVMATPGETKLLELSLAMTETIKLLGARMTMVEDHMGSSGAHPLIDPPTPSVA